MIPLLFVGALTLPPAHATAVRSSSAPRIDGVVDDAAWRGARPTTEFTQEAPMGGAAPSHRTTARIVYDDDALYVAVECEQRGTPVVARMGKRDGEIEADWVWISLDTVGDGKTAFEFALNAASIQQDELHYDDTQQTRTWDEVWEGRAHATPDGWSAEFRIPFSVLRFAPRPSYEWGMQIGRFISHLQEIEYWSYIPRDGAGEVSRYGRLDGLAGISPKVAIEVRPFVTASVGHQDPGATAANESTSAHFSGGVDLKWHVTPELSLDATVNPDFAQVEADALILNLTKYEIEYPEKRPFFFEGMDIFATPMQALYTRRMGRMAPSVQLRLSPSNEVLADIPGPAPILGSAKLAGRLGGGWTLAQMTTLVGSNDVLLQSADGARRVVLADPMAAFEVIRLRKDVDRHAYIGLVATMTERAENGFGYPGVDGAPGSRGCPDGSAIRRGGRCSHDAYVGGADFRWRSPGGDLSASGQVLGSLIQQGPVRTLLDGTRIASGDAGVGGTLRFVKEGGGRVIGGVQAEAESRRLDYNDLGYMARQNQCAVTAFVEARSLTPWRATNETHTRFQTFERHNLDGLTLARGGQLGTTWNLTSFWALGTDTHAQARRHDDREVGDGTALERGASIGQGVYVASDVTKPLASSLTASADALEKGQTLAADLSILLKPAPNFELQLSPQILLTRGEPRFAAFDGTTPVFGRLDARSVGAVVRLQFTITPELSFQGYAQAFLASGHYTDFSRAPGQQMVALDALTSGAPPPTNPDFQQGALNASVVLRWEYRLGSLLYLVYARSQVPSVVLGPNEAADLSPVSLSRAPAADMLLLKLTYWWSV